jgi:hypothetical protein
LKASACRNIHGTGYDALESGNCSNAFRAHNRLHRRFGSVLSLLIIGIAANLNFLFSAMRQYCFLSASAIAKRLLSFANFSFLKKSFFLSQTFLF